MCFKYNLMVIENWFCQLFKINLKYGGQPQIMTRVSQYLDFFFLNLKNPILSSDPGIFSEHEEKQVSRRYIKKAETQTDLWGKSEVEESSMQSFPWQHLTLPRLSHTHRNPQTSRAPFLTEAVKT